MNYLSVVKLPRIHEVGFDALWKESDGFVSRGHLQEHSHADLVPLQDLLARLPDMLLPLDVALSTTLLQIDTKQNFEIRKKKNVSAESIYICMFLRISSNIKDIFPHFRPFTHISTLTPSHGTRNKRGPAVRIFLMLLLPLQGAAWTQIGVALPANVWLQPECDFLVADCSVA